MTPKAHIHLSCAAIDRMDKALPCGEFNSDMAEQMSFKYCDICGEFKRRDEIFLQLYLSNIDDTFDKCVNCVKHDRRIGIFKQRVETNISSFKCDMCKNFICEKCTVINGTLFLCVKCLDPELDLESVNNRVNWMLSNNLS